MLATIQGLLCLVDLEAVDREGHANPSISVFSGDEAVTIRGIEADPSKIGTKISVLCEIKNRTYEGRSYTTIRAVEQKGGKI